MIKKRPDLHAGHRARLRQRFVRGGAEAFSEHELLELLLTFSIPRKDTKDTAKRLLSEFGSLHEVLNASTEKLTIVEGVGQTSAILMRLVRDFYRPSVFASGTPRAEIMNTESAANLLRAEFATATEEKFLVLFLDVSSRLLKISVLSEGTIDRAAVYPRKVAQEAIGTGAAAVILAHNHPRSSPVPSQADKLLTRQLCNSLMPIGVEILDHIILGEHDFYSFAKAGDLNVIVESLNKGYAAV